jgi:DtxR family Mn-dependent transcriptional regulator
MYKAEEDYIKFIYEQSIRKNIVTIKDIALKFNYTEQSVYEMIKKLQSKNLLKYTPYQGVALLKEGLEHAIRMTRAHRIWEVFLQDFLGYDWHEVHEEAEMLEHAGSESMLQRLYEKLGGPKFCQHGNPIPNFEDEWIETSYQSIESVSETKTLRVLKVNDDKPLLLFLKDKNIQLHHELLIVKKYPNHGLIEVEKQNNERVVITTAMAHMIFGEVIESN